MERPCELAERVGKLHLDERSPDMTFIVGGERLPANRALFTFSCDYFKALLDGNMKESLQSEVVLKNVSVKGFKLLMSFVYTGQLEINVDTDEDTILEVLELSHLWGFGSLETKLCEHLKENLSIHNVIEIYGEAHHLQTRELLDACKRTIIEEPNTILRSESLKDLSEPAFCDMLTWDSFCAEEIDIFKAVLRWHLERQPEADPSVVLKEIRLPLIDTKDLLTTVQDSGLVPADVILAAIRQKESSPANLNYRGRLKSDCNLASPACGALMPLEKDCLKNATGGRCVKCDSRLDPSALIVSTSLTIELSEAFFINNIKFHFLDPFYNSYYVEVSMNSVDWIRVVDHTNYRCLLQQNLYFERRVARYVRFIGTDSYPRTLNLGDRMSLKDFEVFHTTNSFELSCGLYAPKENIASKALGAKAFDPRTAEHMSLIEDDNREDVGVPKRWSSHEIGGDPIVIFLPQPYTVSSMRMLLRNDKSQGYRYYIETSVDFENWTRVADHTTEICRSWQNIVFEPRPVLSIKIVGTESTADRSFSCAFFECPAPTTSDIGNPTPSNEVANTDDHRL